MSKQFDKAVFTTDMLAALSAVVAVDATRTDKIGEVRKLVRALHTAGLSDSKTAACYLDLIRSFGDQDAAPMLYSVLQSAVSDETAKMRNEGTEIYVSLERRKRGEVISAKVGDTPQSKAQETAKDKRDAKAEREQAAKDAAAALETGDGIRAALASFKPELIDADVAPSLEEFTAAVVGQLPPAGSTVGLIERLIDTLSAADRKRVAEYAKPAAKPRGRASRAAIAGNGSEPVTAAK